MKSEYYVRLPSLHYQTPAMISSFANALEVALRVEQPCLYPKHSAIISLVLEDLR